MPLLGKSPVFGWNDTIDLTGPHWKRHVCAAPSRAAIQRLVGHNLNPRDAQCFGETWNHYEVEHCRAHPGIVYRVDGSGENMTFIQVAPNPNGLTDGKQYDTMCLVIGEA